jgi:hypothetical protein
VIVTALRHADVGPVIVTALSMTVAAMPGPALAAAAVAAPVHGTVGRRWS